ncbi:hypothetical protein Cni_G02108 [Canna indica]|uniref:Uncharacterized protein n=1 Tax=Canna indica TaxID=4628 RepID=A0AAQ3JP36_9LILI|nr:hypothetical protein Cni_G02108 [Canna indica]
MSRCKRQISCSNNGDSDGDGAMGEPYAGDATMGDIDSYLAMGAQSTMIAPLAIMSEFVAR